MKRLIVTALATASALALGACSPSDSGANNTATADLTVDEGNFADGNAAGNLSPVDDFANAAAPAGAVDNAGLAADAAGNETGVANGL